MRWWAHRPLTRLQKFSLLGVLCILGITVAVTASVATFLSRELVKRDAEVTADLIRTLFTRTIPASYFSEFLAPDRTLYEKTFAEIAATARVEQVKVWDAQGRILWSDNATLIGRRFSNNPHLQVALQGEIQAEIIRPWKEEHGWALRSFDRLEEIYVPIRYSQAGPVVGVLEIYRNPSALFAALDRGPAVVWILGGGGGLLLCLSLFVILQCSSYARTLEERVAERTRELSERASDMSMLYTVSSTINKSLDIQTILDRALERILEAKGFDGGWIGLHSRQGEGCPVVASRGMSEQAARDLARKSSPDEAFEQIIRTGKPVLISDEAGESSDQEFRSMALLPIQLRDRPIGTLVVACRNCYRFTSEDIQLLSSVVQQIGAAVGNAQLYAATHRREREARILYDTTLRLATQTDRESLLRVIVEGAIEITSASCGGIGQLVGEEIVLRPLGPLTLPPGEATIRFPLDGSIAGLTYRTGEPRIVNDMNLCPCALPVREAAKACGIRNFICVPLKAKNATLGVIEVINKREDAAFTQDDLRLLSTFASHAAIVIDNARLFQEMKATKEYLENLIDASVDAIVTLNPRGIVTFVSEGGQRMVGYREEDLLGTSVRSYWAKGRTDFRAFRKLLGDKGRVQNYETELSADDSRVVSVNISASLLRDGAGQVAGILAVLKDVTGLRKLQEQMLRSERLAAAGLLAAGVAHEVGNPLACISSLAQVLHAQAPDPKLQRGLADIQTHVGRIQKIVQDLTHLARPTSFQFRASSLNDIIENAVALARHNPAARRMKITTTLDPAFPQARVAPDQLLQVFLNLILNAADAKGDLTVQAVADGSSARVIFTDSGQGMSADKLRRLFDPFYSAKDGHEHLGLGLFVSHEIIRQHGGTFHVESEPGRGSAFTVVLPLEQ